MNSKRTSVHNKSLLYFCIAMILFLVSNESVQAQSFSLGVREYIQVDGQWYINEDGIIGDQVIPERIVIQLQPEMDIIQFDSSSLNLLGLQVITGLIAENFHVLKVPSNLDPFISATALSNLTEIINIEFDALGEWTESPDDPYWSDQWNLNVSKLNMPAAWDISTGSSSVILAIIDTGVEYEHEDLNGNIWVNPFEDFNGNGRPDFYPFYAGGDLDWIDNDNNGKVDDLVGWDFYGIGDSYPLPDYDVNQDHHGTAVAGIAAAVTDNGIGVAGIAGGWHPTQGVKIMCLRPDYWVDQDNYPHPYESSVAEAVTYAYQNGAKIINLSLALDNSHPAMTSAINEAVNSKVIVVCSSGNSGGDAAQEDDWDVKFPASMSNTIAVGATDANDTRWRTSTTVGSCYGLKLDLMAPTGVGNVENLPTTDLMGSQGVPGNYRPNFGGTSAAAPHVAGLSALIRSLYPTMPWQKVKEAMTETAVDLGAPGKDIYYGDGRIDAFAALSYDYPPPAKPQNFHVEWVPTFGGWNPKLVWNANSEIDLAGYKLKRSLNFGPWITLADLSPTTTYYIDGEVFKSDRGRNNFYAHYKLTAYNIAGSESDEAGPLMVRHSGLVFKQIPENPTPEVVPETFILSGAFPNPFNATTTIHYALPEFSNVEITVFDIMGRDVTTLVNGLVNAGFKEVIWDGTNASGQPVPSGMYFYRLDAKAVESGELFHQSRKMVMMR